MSKRLFRLLLILNWALFVVAIAAFFFTRAQLPPQLRDYVESQPLSGNVGVAYDLLYIIVAVVAWVGVFRFKRWGRELFLAVYIVGLVEIPFGPAIVVTGWVYLVDSLINAVWGITIAAMYFSPIRGAFDSRPDV